MKSTIKTSRLIAAAVIGCFGLFLALILAAPLANAYPGSISAASRSAPPPPPPSRDSHGQAPHPAPEYHPAQRPAPPQHIEIQNHRDWDDHDEDARSWGGFAHGEPIRVIRGQRVHGLPSFHRVFVHNQYFYYDDDGAYYLPQPDGEYLVVQPPVGAVVPALPDGVIPILVGPTTYYYLDGVFYVAQDGSFAVVDPPPGIVVPMLPTGAGQVVMNGMVCYQFNGFNYLPSIQNGVTVYTVTPM